MPSFRSRQGAGYARKGRRIAKYGKYRVPAGARSAIVRGRSGRFMKVMRPKFTDPFARDYELVQLKYRENITLDPAADTLGASNLWNFSFNSVFDPSAETGGHQPMFFDNYAAIYQNYKVSFAKIKVTVVNHSVNTAVWNGTAVAAQPNNSYKLAIIRDTNFSNTGTSMNTLLEQNARNVKWRYVAPQLNGKLPSLKMKCAPHKTLSVSYGDDTLAAATTANPTKQVYGIVAITSADGVTNPPTVNLAVEITYYVKFFNRNQAQTEN